MFEMGAKLEDIKTNETKQNSNSITKNQHQLVFKFEKRNGKPVTLVGQFYVDEKEKKEVLKLLKTSLGTGGTINNEWIEIQGDKKDKIIEILTKNGWKFRKK